MDIFLLHPKLHPEANQAYIIDSNIWLPILGFRNKNIDPGIDEVYSQYFSNIFKKEGSQILLCAIQLSEIFNRLFRYYSNIECKKKYGGNPNNQELSGFYKQEFRNSSKFNEVNLTILDQLDQFSARLTGCEAQSATIDKLTNYPIKSLDFNDNYLYLLAIEKNATIITHDADFFNLTVKVGTCNHRLLTLFKESQKKH